MSNVYQTTVNQAVKFEGIGLHTGLNSMIKILPAKANAGILFKRVDLKENNIIEASYLNVNSTKLCTTLENKFGVKVSTVEHLLAALFVAKIDNAIIEINNQEVPIMDGSSKDFIDALEKTEKINLNNKKNYFKILKKVELSDGKRKISIEPSDFFEVDYQLQYENKIIGQQRNVINFNNDNLEDIIQSRTFCLLKDIEKIKELGLAKGGSLDNAIVIDENKVLNKEGLRNEKEFVNHKILDCIGDLYTSGYRIIANITCSQGGHYLTNQLLRKVFKNKENFSLIEIQEKNLPHTLINRNYLKSIA